MKYNAMLTTKAAGNWGEDLVADFLKTRGFEVVMRNYQKKGGEIDIIARKDNIISFVEVKMRRNAHIDPTEAITPRKQTLLGRMAKCYLSDCDLYDAVVARFDVAFVIVHDHTSTIEYLENAFCINE
jgi:putative endonuclease